MWGLTSSALRSQHAGYLDAPAALACPWAQSNSASLPAVCLVFCAVEGHAAMKVAPPECLRTIVLAALCCMPYLTARKQLTSVSYFAEPGHQGPETA